MSAWGRTGRVVLSEAYEYGSDVTRDIVVDDAPRGRALSPRPEPDRFGGWGAINYDPYGYQDDIPSLDAAVMWVLRRAAPDVWRAERGPVWRVSATGLRVCGLHWRATVPEGDIAYIMPTWAGAMERAQIVPSR